MTACSCIIRIFIILIDQVILIICQKLKTIVEFPMESDSYGIWLTAVIGMTIFSSKHK